MNSDLLITTTTGTFAQWVDTPTTVALVFALAGAFYLGIYALRRLRHETSTRDNSVDLVRLPI